MANTLTPNLGLKKPSGDMNVSRADMNDNWDAIDAANLTKKGTDIAANTDLNDLTTPGKYCSLNAGRSATLVNTPHTSGGFSLYVLIQATGQSGGGLPILMQLLTPSSSSDLEMMPYYRTFLSNGAWTAWKHFVNDALAPSSKGSIPNNTDLNNLKSCGIYLKNSGSSYTYQNDPNSSSYGIFEVVPAGVSANHLIQRFTTLTTVYFRYYTNNGWSAWRKIESTAV